MFVLRTRTATALITRRTGCADGGVRRARRHVRGPRSAESGVDAARPEGVWPPRRGHSDSLNVCGPVWNSKDINRNRWRRHRLAYHNSTCKRMEHDPSNRSGPTIFMNRYAHASSSSSSSSERASEHARIAGHVALHPPTASSRASSVVCTPRGALHHPLPCLALRVAPAFGVRGLRRALVARPPARRHQGDAAAPRYSLVIMHRGSGRLSATEALSGCPGGGGDPARTDVRDDAQQYAEQHSHGRGLGDGSASRECTQPVFGAVCERSVSHTSRFATFRRGG